MCNFRIYFATQFQKLPISKGDLQGPTYHLHRPYLQAVPTTTYINFLFINIYQYAYTKIININANINIIIFSIFFIIIIFPFKGCML